MDAQSENKAYEVFQAARNLDANERAQLLARSCGDDQLLRKKVEQMLRTHDQAAREKSSAGSSVANLTPTEVLSSGVIDASLVSSTAELLSVTESIPMTTSEMAATEERFPAGTIVASRYRINGKIGKGGMGEVYRAEDLVLGETVSLKFLPPALGNHPVWLQALLHEVRMSRQVTHPNVCRIYDIIESDFQHFISMEFIDGENLASLLRRVGRLSDDKTIQITRQLCAGLSAAHDIGVLHRDLKPANIMIDGRGQVHITDFGVAIQVGEIDSKTVRAGTPAYMAPEQLARKNVSPRSDVYCLGLVMYEMVAGRRPFQAKTVKAYTQLHNETPPIPPSEFCDDIDPSLERLILRCLEKDPDLRPASVQAVAAALPAEDPLAAALAAGQTPTAEMVAAAGAQRGLNPQVAIPLALGTLLGMLIALILAGEVFLIPQAGLDVPPQVLMHRAQHIIDNAGYTDAPVDSAMGFSADANYLRYHYGRDNVPALADIGAPLQFWYREGPEYLSPSAEDRLLVHYDDPIISAPGAVQLRLTPDARLLEFRAVPTRKVPPETAPADWTALLSAGGFSAPDLLPTRPIHAPPAYADELAAWTLADVPGVRIEAAAFAGRPVYFEVLAPWSSDGGYEQDAESMQVVVSRVIDQVVFLLLLLGGATLTLRNLSLGRVDHRGALRVAGFVFLTRMLANFLLLAHVPVFQMEMVSFVESMRSACYSAALVWIFYVALEHYVRRLWPQAIISWSRLLVGRFRDPLVGRDVLIGATVGVAGVILLQIEHLCAPMLGVISPAPRLPEHLGFLLDSRHLLGLFFDQVMAVVYVGLSVLLLMLLLRVIVRKAWIAGTLFVIIQATALSAIGADPLVSWLFFAAIWTAIAVAVARVGLVAMISGAFFWFILNNFAQTIELNQWYAASSIFALAILGSVTIWAMLISMTGQRSREMTPAKAG